MTDLNFNIFGFTRPNTQAEILSLLDEAIRLADELEEQISVTANALEKSAVHSVA